MTDDTPPSTPQPYRPLPRLKRLAITFALLFVIWAVFTYVVPYFMGYRSAPRTMPPAQSSAPASLPPDYAARFEALENRVKALEEKPVAAPAAPDERVSDLNEKMTS